MKQNHAQVVPFFVVNHQLDTTYLRQFVNDCADAGMVPNLTNGLRSGTNRLELHVSNTLDNFIYGRPSPSGLKGGVALRAYLP